jgi:hypothetical protein
LTQAFEHWLSLEQTISPQLAKAVAQVRSVGQAGSPGPQGVAAQ